MRIKIWRSLGGGERGYKGGGEEGDTLLQEKAKHILCVTHNKSDTVSTRNSRPYQEEKLWYLVVGQRRAVLFNTWWYWVRIGWYWLAFGGSGSVVGVTG